ncbi:hypothetical protein Pyrde_1962 [Pyrodictium delaneyi]|uniref:Uncharacterized protein n=2 Tax=Pyrodictium delaneyi TaxID=1273541 RepID=A0A0P0N5S9_9CREN|nr:hypothetical protein [Pyrodictium delaneyi]ALL02005.1 hypothetical protein Pyrde_1962 [Pyrodictium delaneyi]
MEQGILAVKRDPNYEQRLRRLMELAIRRYNRYRGAESRARLLKIQGDRAYVVFEGSFCATCGINDWVDDLRYTLEDLGAEAELVAVIEPPEPSEFYDYRIGVFRIKRIPENLDQLEREEQELEEYFNNPTE